MVPSSTTWYGRLRGIRAPAVMFLWGAKEYLIGHAVLGGFLSIKGSFFAWDGRVGVRVECAPGNAVERDSAFVTLLGSTSASTVTSRLQSAARRSACSRPGGRSGRSGMCCPAEPRTRNVLARRSAKRGEGGQLLAVTVEAELEWDGRRCGLMIGRLAS